MNAPLNTPRNVTFTLGADCQFGKAGEQVTLAVNPVDVNNQTTELENYLGGYKPYEFCADLASGQVPVDKEAGTRRDFSMENAFEVVDTRNGRNGAIKEVKHLSQTGSYKTEEYSLAAFVPFASQNDAAPLYNVRSATSAMLMTKLLLHREVRVFTALATLANWNSNNRTSITTNFKWDNGSTKDPLADLHARIKASAQPVTHILMNPDSAFYFLRDATVIAYMKQMLGDNAPSPAIADAAHTEAQLQRFRLPGIQGEFVIVPGKKLNTSTGVLDYILGDDVLLLSNPANGFPTDGNTIMSHMTFRAKGRSGTGVTVNEYVPNGRGIEGGWMLEVGFKEDLVFGSTIAGGLLKDVLSF